MKTQYSYKGRTIKNLNRLQRSPEIENSVSAFAPSFFTQNTIEYILQDTARNCVNEFGFSDCVIYEKDELRRVLIRRTASPENPDRRFIDSIEIELGKGIVGTVAQTGKAEIIKIRSILDEEERLLEMAVPIFVDGKIFGIIYSKHWQKNFCSEYDLRLVEKIASICAERIFKCITEERLRSKIARDLHDNMGSGLSSISIYGQIAKLYNHQQRKEDLQVILDKINETSGEMIAELNDIVWAINPRNDSMNAILQRMESFAKPLLASKNINIDFEYYSGILNVQLELTKRKNVLMVFKEAINNAVKYADCTFINVSLNNLGNHFYMMITDNGKGFSMSNYENQGNGLRNMRLRCEEMKGKLNLKSRIGNGTTVELCFPIPD